MAYRNGLDNPFVFDDRATVLLNPALAAPWHLGAALRDLPHPAVALTYAIDRGLWGFSSFGFHITNGVLHLAVVGLLYGWCTRTLPDRDPPEWPAFFAAAFFGLHPLMSAAGGYVSARGEILAAAGFIGALTFARRAIVRSSGASAIVAAACGAIAVTSSAAAIALPLVVLALDAWVVGGTGWGRRVWRVYAPSMAAVAAIVWWSHDGALPLDAPATPGGPVASVLSASIVVWRLVGLMIAPYGQAPVHDVRLIASAFDPIALLCLAAIAAVAAAAIAMRQSSPLVSFGLVWFIATLLPIAIVAAMRDAMAEHRMYLPAAGLVFAAAAAAGGPIARRYPIRLVGYGVLILCGFATVRQQHAWAEPLDSWRAVARREPRAWEARFQLAEVLRESGACDAALVEYDAALQLNPNLGAAAAGRAACAGAR